MDIRPIRTNEDYDWALREIEPYFDDEPAIGSAEADRFDVLSALIKVYEDREYPVAEMDAVDAISSHLANAGLNPSDLATVLGSASRASEILARKRGISVPMAFKIQEAWGLPVELLLRPGPPGGKRAA